MSDNLLDFASHDEKTGFRLQAVEILNWGTFDRRVWRLGLNGDNTLLTGDIGSGKSTLVDAITTLLVPPQKLAYNKAAGAEARERTLRSYVMGHFKSERGELGLSAKAVALRDHNSYSVILGTFHNEGFGLNITLSQVFWMKDLQGQPARFYLVADHPLSITADFADFGSDIGNLRKRLRGLPGVELFDSFPSYAATFRRHFGLDNDQALELFNQTVSLKSVGNLTDFVREHMLEAFDAGQRIEALIHHFDDLNRAHEAVLKAKAQLAALVPLVEDCQRFGEMAKTSQDWRTDREALKTWVARHKLALLDKRLANLETDTTRLDARLASATQHRQSLQADRDELKQAIAANGGDRLERLAMDIRAASLERDRRHQRLERYRQPALNLELPLPQDADSFARNRQALAARRVQLADREASLQNVRTEREVELRQLRGEHSEIQRELESLRHRRSNITQTQVAIRTQLCTNLAIHETKLPFAGELLQVRPDQTSWEGAAERLLHGFALSLLVPEEHYPAVAAWVDDNRLNGRLVYFRVRPPTEALSATLHPESLVHKLDIKADSALVPWLERELARRFDYACCQNLEQFHRERQALTRQGQTKGSGERHEKDDRHRLDDRSRYVLGWSNESKIKTLEDQARQRENAIQQAAMAISQLQQEQQEQREKLDCLAQLEGFSDWTELDWQPLSLRIAELEQEKNQLESSANQLRILSERLGQIENQLKSNEKELDELSREKGKLEEKQTQAVTLHQLTALTLTEERPLWPEQSYPRLDALAAERETLKNLSVESCDNRERELRDLLQANIDAENKKLDRLREKITNAMQAYRTAWPLETREVDASLEAAPAFRAMLGQLQADDLPRFERTFKELLNENTIREVANFQSQLNRERQQIKERIERINQSLTQIDYNPGRYIVLESQTSPDGEVRDFLADLRSCTEGSLTGSADEQYSEAKFLQVKRIIERFRGRDGYSELDRRWTKKVSDVRQYFVFSASERWREDHSEFEHYTDSGGKSGGQKEKLAYTVLAASLAYQFGLEWGEVRSRSFRFVMIDEAFGRGSDESARYGLELFKRLNLQLLVITPLQKIHIIEPFVAAVGFVHNEDGRESKLRNLSIQEYRTERDRRRQGSAPEAS